MGRGRCLHSGAAGGGRCFAARASAAALACTLAACGGGTAPRLGEQQAAAVCPGVDVGSLNALYVSPQGSDSTLCDADAPCKTIVYAQALASAFGGRALVLQHGLYQTTETIDLKGGTSLYGSCRFNGEPDNKYRSVIQASPAPGTPALRANGVNVTVSGVVVIGSDQPAGANIAMTVAQANVTLRGTTLLAGNGGPGAQPPPLMQQRPAAARVGADRCYPPGGAPNTSPWGQIDLVGFNWAAGNGGSGSNAGIYDTGPGGVGGQQGGASIGLLLLNSAVVGIVADEFNRVIAGSGGTGGAGQAGPSFGLGGGANSGGAGGNGGPSIGVAYSNAAGPPASGLYAYAGMAGGPGAGGAAGVDSGQCSGDPGAPGAPGGSAPVQPFAVPSVLMPGEWLAPGQSLYSPNLQVRLIMQGDSNLCLYSAGNPLWCSQTQGQGIYQAIMQSDGNMCMYETQGQFLPVCSGSAGYTGARLTVQDSGHAQILSTSGAAVWSRP